MTILTTDEVEDDQVACKLITQLSSLLPSVPLDRLRLLRPHLSVLWRVSEKAHTGGDTSVKEFLGVASLLHVHDLSSKENALIVTQQLTDIYGAVPYAATASPLTAVSNKMAMRELEDARPSRSPLVDPSWMGDIVTGAYKELPPGEPIFPEITNREDVARLTEYLDEWCFFAPSLTRPELLTTIILLFERFDLFSCLDVDIEMFRHFILLVEHNYCDNPYHNFRHAVDVLQCCYFLLNTSMMMRRMFKPLDVFALFVAALCHDIGHGSFSNAFLVEMESLVAWLYNDRSVLENMHATVLFAILRHPKYNFAHRWGRPRWRDFRSLVISCILGTDMSLHVDYIKQLTGIDGAFARSLELLNGGEGILPLEERRLIAIAIIKVADICNVVRPFEYARQWGFHLMCEFFHQGDWEKILGLQSTPMTIRSLTDLAKGQQYFLNNVAAPLFRCLSEFFSEFYFVEEHLKSNIESWRVWRPEADEILPSYLELYPLTDQQGTRDRHYSRHHSS